jgi:hypothetical protein
MTTTELKRLLEQNPDKKIHFILPDFGLIPVHFHITEVGHVRKDFIDCGGTRRSTSACVLQAWVADDENHSLTAGKFASILKLADKVLPAEDLEVEIEFEAPLISQFPVESSEVTADTVIFRLTTKSTDCLAKEKCGVENAPSSCSVTNGCC